MDADRSLMAKYQLTRNTAIKLIKNHRVSYDGNVINDRKTQIYNLNQLNIMDPTSHRIIWENNNFLMVYKYPGISVARTLYTPKYETVLNEQVAKTHNLCHGYKSEEFGLLHRIDKDTSGLLLMCKNDYYRDRFFMANNQFTKIYHAYYDWVKYEHSKDFFCFICEHGNFIIGDHGGCKCTMEYHRKQLQLNLNGNPHIKALTTTHMKKNYKHFSCKIIQGKKHQIRMAMKHIGFPIWGDKLYNPNNKGDTMLLICNYLSINPRLLW